MGRGAALSVETSVLLVLLVSAAASVYLWTVIYRSGDPRPMKVMLAIGVAIPVIRPLFWPSRSAICGCCRSS